MEVEVSFLKDTQCGVIHAFSTSDLDLKLYLDQDSKKQQGMSHSGSDLSWAGSFLGDRLSG